MEALSGSHSPNFMALPGGANIFACILSLILLIITFLSIRYSHKIPYG